MNSFEAAGGIAKLRFETVAIPRWSRFVLLQAILWSIVSYAGEPPSWQRVPSKAELQGLQDLPAVPASNIYEVVPTKVEAAFEWHLKSKPFAELTCEDANFLTGGHYLCEKGAKAILVRGVYTNGGTGSFAVHNRDTVVYIFHGSLGQPGSPINIPLIITVPFIPTDLFAWTTSAM